MPNTRREFLLSTAAAGALAAATPERSQLGISLAAWSMSGSFFQGKWKLLELPGITRERLGLNGLEHVNQFFENPTLNYLQKLKQACADNGINQYMIMVDHEGSTAAIDGAERKQSEIAHRKWIDTANYLGSKYVRCNFYGGLENWKEDRDLVSRGAQTFQNLCEYAKGSGVEILVENHGRASSDPDLLVALVKAVNHPLFGLLVDLGNWNKGDDRYAAVRKTIPYGRGLSVKGTYGDHLDPAFDMEKLMRVALEGSYKGWWGIEVGPRRQEGVKLTADQQFEREVQTVREVKAIVDRVVFQKA
jgi:L-ribulose-5-phosphate 3-epimerase